jgi:hypothetical protein
VPYALRALTPTTKGLDWRTGFAKATQPSYVPSCPMAIPNKSLRAYSNLCTCRIKLLKLAPLLINSFKDDIAWKILSIARNSLYNRDPILISVLTDQRVLFVHRDKDV